MLTTHTQPNMGSKSTRQWSRRAQLQIRLRTKRPWRSRWVYGRALGIEEEVHQERLSRRETRCSSRLYILLRGIITDSIVRQHGLSRRGGTSWASYPRISFLSPVLTKIMIR